MKALLPLLIAAALLTGPLFAQSSDTASGAPATPPPDETATPHPHMGPGPAMPPGGRLTREELQELAKARQDALAANPDLAAKQKDLIEQLNAVQKQIKDAMIAADPNVAAILAKMPPPPHGGPSMTAGGQPPPPPPQQQQQQGPGQQQQSQDSPPPAPTPSGN